MTRLFSIIIGITFTIALLALMVLARLLSPQAQDQPDLELREIELVEWVEPPPPPPEIEEPAEDCPPPPPMAMIPNLLPTDDPDAPTVVSTDLPIPMELGVEEFSLETDVAALPTPKVPVKPRRTKRSKPTKRRPKPVRKSSYSIGELDGKPRVISTPSIRFPKALARRGVKQGKVMVEVAISPSGRSSLRRIISASHPELKSAATRIANGARLTPPKRNGEPVTAVMRWPLIIR